MHDIFIWFKFMLSLTIVWFADTAIIWVASISIINPTFREFCIESKDVINVLISITVLLVTIIKFRNERRKR